MPSNNKVPHLRTALTGNLKNLEKKFIDNNKKIEAFFRKQFQITPAPFYASVDLRNSGYKLAPVDTNLFPAGFNNLHSDLRPLAIQAAQQAVQQACPIADGVLIIPENHTRNLHYLENIFTLKEILESAGYEVKVASLKTDSQEISKIELASGNSLTLHKLKRQGDRVGVDNFFPCAVLLNNDMSSGRPEILEDLEQVLLPPLDLGWISRYKTDHFMHYKKVAKMFAEVVGIDPWLITPRSVACGPVDFKNKTGLNCLANSVNEMLDDTQNKYKEHDISCPPFAIIKSDSGTYGMSIMSVKTSEEVLDLNRKQRNKMSSVKDGLNAKQMLVQEGIYTYEDVDGAVAEPVVYMIHNHVVGGFYRVHTGKTTTDNLNSPGMHFFPLSFEKIGNISDNTQELDSIPNRFYAYGVVARLALLAASIEIHEAENAKNI